MISSYSIQGNYIYIQYLNRSPLTISLIKDSGRMLWRPKFGAKHTGTLLGIDVESNEPFVVHHHPDCQEGSCIVPLSEFGKGNPVSFSKETCINDRYTSIKEMLDNIIRGDKYHPIFDNCQMKTNDACTNVRKSPDLTKWVVIGVAALILFIVVFVSALSRR